MASMTRRIPYTGRLVQQIFCESKKNRRQCDYTIVYMVYIYPSLNSNLYINIYIHLLPV